MFVTSSGVDENFWAQQNAEFRLPASCLDQIEGDKFVDQIVIATAIFQIQLELNRCYINILDVIFMLKGLHFK